MNVGFAPESGAKADMQEGPDRADIFAKRFCSSDRARLIRAQAPKHKIDSNILPFRFDCLFHGTFAATFATISANRRGRPSHSDGCKAGARQRLEGYPRP